MFVFFEFTNAVRSRKKTRNPSNHKEKQRKRLVQRGEKHVTKSGNIIEAKQFKGQENCKCFRKCAERISVARQKQIFKDFYTFENWSSKVQYLRSLVQSVELKQEPKSIQSLKKKYSQTLII